MKTFPCVLALCLALIAHTGGHGHPHPGGNPQPDPVTDQPTPSLPPVQP